MSSNVFPSYAMGLASTNLFVGLSDFTVNGWKRLDYNDWNSGDISATNARSYGSNGPSGSTLEVNGPNMPNPPSAGRYRVSDGRARSGTLRVPTAWASSVTRFSPSRRSHSAPTAPAWLSLTGPESNC